MSLREDGESGPPTPRHSPLCFYRQRVKGQAVTPHCPCKAPLEATAGAPPPRLHNPQALGVPTQRQVVTLKCGPIQVLPGKPRRFGIPFQPRKVGS